MDTENRDFIDDFITADSLPVGIGKPKDYAAALIELPENQAICQGGAAIDWLFRLEPKMKGGKQVLGTAYMPGVQGELRPLFDWLLSRYLGRQPDFLIILDYAYWQVASRREQEILCFHEMLHCSQALGLFGEPRFHKDGSPMWAIREHDITEFDAVAARYGAHSEDVRKFAAALNSFPGYGDT